MRKTIIQVALVAAFLVQSRGRLFGQTMTENPIQTSLCQLIKEPLRFNGKIVRFRSEFVSKFQWAGFVNPECSAKVPIDVFHPYDGLRTEQGEYAFTTAGDDNTHPERLNWKPIQPLRTVRLIKDDNYRAFRRYINPKFRWPDSTICQDCPLYRIEVTAVGRFDYFDTQTVSVRANPRAKPIQYAAGDLNSPLLRIAIESVSGVVATAIAPEVYSASHRRNLSLEEADGLARATFKDQPFTKHRAFTLEPYTVSDYPDFQFFQGLYANPGGSGNLGHYAVDRRTGDVWDVVICERVKTASVIKTQKAIRNRIALTDDEYRKIRRPGPCAILKALRRNRNRKAAAQWRSRLQSYARQNRRMLFSNR